MGIILEVIVAINLVFSINYIIKGVAIYIRTREIFDVKASLDKKLPLNSNMTPAQVSSLLNNGSIRDDNDLIQSGIIGLVDKGVIEFEFLDGRDYTIKFAGKNTFKLNEIEVMLYELLLKVDRNTERKLTTISLSNFVYKYAKGVSIDFNSYKSLAMLSNQDKELIDIDKKEARDKIVENELKCFATFGIDMLILVLISTFQISGTGLLFMIMSFFTSLIGVVITGIMAHLVDLHNEKGLKEIKSWNLFFDFLETDMKELEGEEFDPYLWTKYLIFGIANNNYENVKNNLVRMYPSINIDTDKYLLLKYIYENEEYISDILRIFRNINRTRIIRSSSKYSKFYPITFK